ncbi:MAG: hypothetical protein NTV30_01830, partial [Chloroflexi bacterium]|nr:hypothetical protein [Chloroflexota bacterium]
RYPLTGVILYNSITFVHFLLGGLGLILGFHSWPGYLSASIYLIFSFGEMYLVMPLKVCPDCVYYKLGNSLCISGLNIISRRFVKEGKLENFSNRARGKLCPNNLYLASLIIPIIALIPALLAIFLAIITLLLFRFFIVFPKIACIHCRAKNLCPNAKTMGLNRK